MAYRAVSVSIFEDAAMTIDEMDRIGHHWLGICVTGILLILCGAAAFALPIASTLSVNFGLAALLTAGGVVWLFQAVRLRRRRGTVVRIVQSVLAILVGGMIFKYPSGGILSVSLALSFYFFISAAAQFLLATAMRPLPGWWWGYVAAATSFLLGLYIVVTFPFSALWIPGALVGVELVVAGVSLVAFAIQLRRRFARSFAA